MKDTEVAHLRGALWACLALLVANLGITGWWWRSVGIHASAVPLLLAVVSVPLSALGAWMAVGHGLYTQSPRAYRALRAGALAAGLLAAMVVGGLAVGIGMTPGCEWCALVLIVGLAASPVVGLHAASWTGLLGATLWLAVTRARGAPHRLP